MKKSSARRAAAAVCAVCLLFAGCSGNSAPDMEALENGGLTSSASSDDSMTMTEDSASSETLSFSIPSGFYDTDITLEITCSAHDAEIYYTLDGNTPTKESTKYTAPITLSDRSSEPNVLSAATGTSAGGDYAPKKKVDKCNVVRACAFLPDGTKTEIMAGSYFIGINRAEKYGDLPVISLLTDTSNLFNKETGIYVLGQTYEDWKVEQTGGYEAWEAVGNYSNHGKEWERPVTADYIPADGSEGFTQNFGMRIMGAASRNATQKSLKLTSREEYGSKNLHYELFPGNMRSDGEGVLDKYKSFVLRNGGNDCDFAKVRDPYIHRLVSDRNVETEANTPCIVFIDGEFWGLYAITEDYSDNYFTNNYGVDKSNVVIVKRGEIEDGTEEDMLLYNELYDFITGNDMTKPENYEKACEMIDMDSLIDYTAINLYINNEDSIFYDNNWRMWRVREADGQTAVSDGKWRMVLYDTDYSTGIYDGGKAREDNISPSLSCNLYRDDGVDDEGNVSKRPADMIGQLCSNPDFYQKLVTVMCDLRNVNFEVNSSVATLMDMYEEYAVGVPATFERFGPKWVVDQDPSRYFDQKITGLADFMDTRYRKYPEIMQKALCLSDAANMTMSISDSTKGSVSVNTVRPDPSKEFKGVYFTDYPVELEAIPADGGSFDHWEYEGCEIADPASPKISVSFTGDFSITAVFR